jgi:hypothetical protein
MKCNGYPVSVAWEVVDGVKFPKELATIYDGKR